MASPFSSNVFYQKDYVFDVPTGVATLGNRGNLTTPTTPLTIRFYLKKPNGSVNGLGSQLTNVLSQSAFITAVNGDRNVITADILPGSVGRDGDSFIKVLEVLREPITTLRKVWGDRFSVQVTDRAILANKS